MHTLDILRIQPESLYSYITFLNIKKFLQDCNTKFRNLFIVVTSILISKTNLFSWLSFQWTQEKVNILSNCCELLWKFFLFHFCSIFCVHIIELECFVDFRYHYVMRTCNEIRNNILSLNSYFRFVLIEFCSDVSYIRFLNL